MLTMNIYDVVANKDHIVGGRAEEEQLQARHSEMDVELGGCTCGTIQA